MEDEDHYQLLGVSPDASYEEIRRRFRFLAFAFHPDRFGSPAHKEVAEETFKKINEAYQIPSDPRERDEYDRQRSSTFSTYEESAWRYAEKVIHLAFESWAQQDALSREVPQFRHVVEAADRLDDVVDLEQQVSPLVARLHRLLHRGSADEGKTKTVHLALAVVSALMRVEGLPFYHLNRACDCTVRLMGSAWSADQKAAYGLQRDPLREYWDSIANSGSSEEIPTYDY